MLEGWVAVVVAIAYLSFLFVVASWGDRRRKSERSSRPFIYALSLAVYCTSWTFFGSVGLATHSGYDFLTIYVGPILLFALGLPLILKIIRIAKAQNITSIADFISARYGKSQTVAALVAVIAMIGTIPYISLQLKAVSSSLSTVLKHSHIEVPASLPVFGDLALLVAISMILFSVAFGTRHIDATEHQDGLVLAIATESAIKLVAFLAVGIAVVYGIFGGPADLYEQAMMRADAYTMLNREVDWPLWFTMTLLSFGAAILLPRQFHLTVVENNGEEEVRRAAWFFPTYLILINLFVIPIAIAGLLTFAAGTVDADSFVLALPLATGWSGLTLVAFVGGLSAATAMVIVECIAIAIMISNDIVVPLAIKLGWQDDHSREGMGRMLLATRRIAIGVVILLAYVYYRSAGDTQLSAIGLLSFAAIAQFAPAFFGGLIWKRATAKGAIAGMTVGTLIWAYTLLLPTFAQSGMLDPSIVNVGPFGIPALKPQALLGLQAEALVHGVWWSLTANIAAFIAFSFLRAPNAIERLQSNVFVSSDTTQVSPGFRLWRSAVSVEELIDTVARYLGVERTRRSFMSFAQARRISLDPKREADIHLLRYAEHLLASAIGAASSRLVLSLLLRKRTVSTRAALKLLDDASSAIQYNREILQTALDHTRQGIAVFDADLQLLVWNRQFGELLDLSPDMVRVGLSLDEIVAATVRAQGLGGDIGEIVAERLEYYQSDVRPFTERFDARNLVIEVRSNRMPDGGLVTTFTDITERVAAAEALERSNETLEGRVRQRTEELTALNAALERARLAADEANLSKTKFLAAASHDILQPLNAARLYITSLVERRFAGRDGELIENVDQSLEAVEEILGALLDISRLDAGAMKAEVGAFHLDEMMRQLDIEFRPMAEEKGLRLTFVPCSLTVRTDRRLMKRLLQNLISNAIKYTAKGRILVGCRRRRGRVRIDVIDTGSGIPASKRKLVFREFQRLDEGAKVARGLGLGLSIVERIARLLEHPVDLDSTLGKGTRFSIEMPAVSAPRLEKTVEEAPKPQTGTLQGLAVLTIDNEPKILDGMETLLTGWHCNVIKAPGAIAAAEALHDARMVPEVMLVDYHLDEGTGLDAIKQLRWRFGADMLAILITADRTPALREEAAEMNVHVLNKPLKPAALRALLAQWRAQKLAAE